MKNIRFGAVYTAPPMFCSDPDELGYIFPEELGLPESLIKDIYDWDLIFQKTFCDEYPPDSGFHSSQEVVSHNLVGKELAQRVEDVLGVNVAFIPIADD